MRKEGKAEEPDELIISENDLNYEEDEIKVFIETDMKSAHGKDFATFKPNLICLEQVYRTPLSNCNKQQAIRHNQHIGHALSYVAYSRITNADGLSILNGYIPPPV
ncbi:hypothetical protein CEXT_358611 [Caerostris extrusa]|uniref:Uncharacterized protein n=1 Tax=Caerostris extrusa TaxID=172846 RepID=A0AAV4P9S3_CAEEX|nr:hypothetical protein CEXT_358611 [Caerostris extrusa]